MPVINKTKSLGNEDMNTVHLLTVQPLPGAFNMPPAHVDLYQLPYLLWVVSLQWQSSHPFPKGVRWVTTWHGGYKAAKQRQSNISSINMKHDTTWKEKSGTLTWNFAQKKEKAQQHTWIKKGNCKKHCKTVWKGMNYSTTKLNTQLSKEVTQPVIGYHSHPQLTRRLDHNHQSSPRTAFTLPTWVPTYSEKSLPNKFSNLNCMSLEFLLS